MFISLRYKFLFMSAVLLMVSILAFLFLATNLFNSDKKAYIYDNNAALVESFAEEINTSVQSIIKTMKVVGITYTQETVQAEAKAATIKRLFNDEANLVDLIIFETDAISGASTLKPVFHLVNEPYLAPFKLDKSYMERIFREKPIPVKEVLKKGIVLRNASLPDGIALLTLAIAFKAGDPNGKTYVISVNLEQNKRLQMLNRSAVYSTFLIDHNGVLLAHRDVNKTLESENMSTLPIVKEIIGNKVEAGAREYMSDDGIAYIASYKKLAQLNLILVSQIPASTAFAASARLIEKSILFAVLILALSFIVSILFTKRLTGAIQRLYQGTISIGQGNFDVKVPVKTKDEVGSLSVAFNKMTGEITRLLKETADKARMEKELETAQLVQDNFFPESYVKIDGVEIASFFKPASECGGDWWGHFKINKTLFVMLGDATGHGVGAALMTAATHSCTSVLKWLYQQNSIANLSASSIMSCLNAAVFHTGRKQVKMTFFVAAIDIETGVVRYCNASHDSPLICPLPSPGASLTHKDLEPLTGLPDPCLGQDLDAVFHEHEITLQRGHAFILHTDGLTECANRQQEEYGERRLVRSIVKGALLDAQGLKESIVAEAQEFWREGMQTDDITLVVIKRPLDVLKRAV